jgi:protein-S-isoprenylcysteine O-methyltransferase Ste14
MNPTGGALTGYPTTGDGPAGHQGDADGDQAKSSLGDVEPQGGRGPRGPGPPGAPSRSITRPRRPHVMLQGLPNPNHLPVRVQRLIRISANLVGAGGAALFAQATLQADLHTHRLIGAAFFIEQAWVVVAYLVRRPAQVVSRRWGDWSLAFGGTFGSVLFRPDGAHPHWGLDAGLGVQLLGLAICVASFVALGRSFGFAAADRGLVRRGPYAVVRHPIYASYFLLQFGYLLQSISAWNALVMLFVSSCNIGRAIAEERLMVTSDQYEAYRNEVRWRLLPGVW